jgi:starch synthase
MVASEAVPFAKTGGLADVVGALASALRSRGCRVFIIMPLYRVVPDDLVRPTRTRLKVPVGDAPVAAGVWRGKGLGGVTTYLLDIPALYDRPSLYGDRGADYPDNLTRFTALSRGALELLRTLDIRPDILHVHDWQTALVPLYLRSLYRRDAFYRDTRSVLTLHNLSYQGRFDTADIAVTGLEERWATPRFLEYFGELRLLKGGILTADRLTTVSPTYEKEILTPAFGCGFDGVLRTRRAHLRGILNGIDTRMWDPATDPYLPARFSARHIQGKGRCRRALLEEMRLPSDLATPLFGVVNRLVEQKGLHLLVEALPDLLELDTRWVVLGNGDPGLELAIARVSTRYPDRVALRLDFDESLAHRIYAGIDYLMMPSVFEPCGLSQMYAMRYGSVPVVRRVGGLADSVTDLAEDPAAGTGFVFDDPDTGSLTAAIERAVGVYRDRDVWPALRRRAMRSDFSWKSSAQQYLDVYREIMGRPRIRIPAGP